MVTPIAQVTEQPRADDRGGHHPVPSLWGLWSRGDKGSLASGGSCAGGRIHRRLGSSVPGKVPPPSSGTPGRRCHPQEQPRATCLHPPPQPHPVQVIPALPGAPASFTSSHTCQMCPPCPSGAPAPLKFTAKDHTLTAFLAMLGPRCPCHLLMTSLPWAKL